MNHLQVVGKAQEVIRSVEPDFTALAKIHGAGQIEFAREASFAMDILKNSEFLANAAMGNVDAFKRAIINVAALGLTLNPLLKLAYLIPRKGKVCLDISYRGFIQMAVDEKSIQFAVAEVVYSKDKFALRGIGLEPLHERDPFSTDRGEIVGAYCVARLHSGEFLTTVMNLIELGAIRDRSESWQAHVSKGVQTPWKTDEAEMVKKTVIRRAHKSWPMTDTRRKLEDILDVTDGADSTAMETKPALGPSRSEETVNHQRLMLAELNKEEAAYTTYLSRLHKRKIEKLEDLMESEASASINFLSELVDKKNVKESKNENVG